VALFVIIIGGFLRGITIVMNGGNITATILNFGERTLGQLGKSAFAIVTYISIVLCLS